MKKPTLTIAVLSSLFASYWFRLGMSKRSCGYYNFDEVVLFSFIGIAFVLSAAFALIIFISLKTKRIVWWLGIFNFIIPPALLLSNLLIKYFLGYDIPEIPRNYAGIIWASFLLISLLVMWKKKLVWLYSSLAGLLSLLIILAFVWLSVRTYAVLSPLPEIHCSGG